MENNDILHNKKQNNLLKETNHKNYNFLNLGQHYLIFLYLTRIKKNVPLHRGFFIIVLDLRLTKLN
jgi:hypothetical protein